MSIRFQADADFNEKIIAAVLRREPAIDFRTAVEAGLPGLEDPVVLAVTAESNRVLVSHDLKTMPRHFGQLVLGASSPGVILIPQRMPIAEAVENLILIWAATEPGEWIDRVYIVPS